MRIDKPQPESFVYVRASLNANMMDLRAGHRGLKFGLLGDVARQYGIRYRQLPTCLEFFGPKPRMRVFIEKLHFSRTLYSYSPF